MLTTAKDAGVDPDDEPCGRPEALRPRRGELTLPLWELLLKGHAVVLTTLRHRDEDLVLAQRVEGPHPRRLTATERAVCAGAAKGQTNAEIAFDLRLKESTVGSHASHALRKLGVGRRVEAILFRHRSQLVPGLRVGSALLLTLTPLPPLRPGVGLSPAERTVFQGLVEGLSNAEIAARRGVSYRTVANQVTSVLKKHAVGSREELVAGALVAGREGRVSGP